MRKNQWNWLMIGVIAFLALAAIGFTIAAVVCENKCRKEGFEDTDYTGKCQCTNPPYWGDACEKTCAGYLSDKKECCSGKDHGTWDPKANVCNCIAPWKAPDCSSQSCPKDCSGHGTCDEKSGKCTCKGNWTGDDCATCPAHWDPAQDCAKCLPNWDIATKCAKCLNKWSGDDCKTCPAHIDPAQGCVAGKCLPHWSGDDCTTCPAHWDSAKDCNDCLSGWGPDIKTDPNTKCATPMCPGWKDWKTPQCSAHGTCVPL